MSNDNICNRVKELLSEIIKLEYNILNINNIGSNLKEKIVIRKSEPDSPINKYSSRYNVSIREIWNYIGIPTTKSGYFYLTLKKEISTEEREKIKVLDESIVSLIEKKRKKNNNNKLVNHILENDLPRVHILQPTVNIIVNANPQLVNQVNQKNFIIFQNLIDNLQLQHENQQLQQENQQLQQENQQLQQENKQLQQENQQLQQENQQLQLNNKQIQKEYQTKIEENIELKGIINQNNETLEEIKKQVDQLISKRTLSVEDNIDNESNSPLKKYKKTT
ncbi:RmlC-like cupin family protein [Tieghemostelium lacteum]|uniref:RmlC-like cupin family protein n=1 Tax=Tieghemostelium lacteum TaxID=361077 RepID=A0A151Z7U6_TIELA|nr:RmlC-like cupin family protein [Tieghemostelium lacteum]|eukprot:KYQ90039.1 RmlC-like cupin family protein [Tieghemostelium lacteum]